MSVMKLAAAWYERKLRPGHIERYLDEILTNARPAAVPLDGSGLIVACVQRRIKPVANAKPFIRDLDRFVRRASEAGAALVVFPEYNFFDLLGMIPGFSVINELLHRRAMRERGRAKGEDGIRPRPADPGAPAGLGAFFLAIAAPVEQAMKQIMSRIAQAYGIHVYSGSYVLGENGRLYNAGSVFGPDGRCLCTQKKMHLTDEESAMGMSRGNRLDVLDLPFGRAAFPICMDATYFETFRIAVERGAEIVALPISNAEEYDLPSSLRGIWGRVIESYVYGLKASQNGWVAGMHFTGIAGVFAPVELTPNGDGLLASSPTPEGDSLAVARIDVEALRRARAEASYYGDSNPAFERDYVKKAYIKNEE